MTPLAEVPQEVVHLVNHLLVAVNRRHTHSTSIEASAPAYVPGSKQYMPNAQCRGRAYLSTQFQQLPRVLPRGSIPKMTTWVSQRWSLIRATDAMMLLAMRWAAYSK